MSRRKYKARGKSILQPDVTRKNKVCYITGATGKHLECHHIYGGNPNRQISDENGFWVYLTPQLHRKAHEDTKEEESIGLQLKKACQVVYERTGTREDFRKLIGKSYL